MAAIDLKESDPGYSTSVILRNTWLEFCKSANIPVPTSNPIMLAMSSKMYRLLFDHVSYFQESLVGDDSTGDQSSPVVTDGDDAYYCFGGAAICAMLKNQYKDIKNARVLLKMFYLWKFLCFEP